MTRIFDRLYSRIMFLKFRYLYKHVTIGRGTNFRFGLNLRVSKTSRITIGEGCFFNRKLSIACYDSVSIGNNCIFGESVKIYDHNHKFSNRDVLIKDQGFNISPITIGDNVWIGSNVIILKGVTIGSNSVIGAGLVVKEDIPSNSLVTEDRHLSIQKIR